MLKAFYFIGLEGLADILSCRRPEHLDCTCKQFLPPWVFHSFAKITSLGLRVLPLYKSAETVFDDSVFSFWLFVFSMTATFATLLTSRGAFSSHASLLFFRAHERVNFNLYCKMICSSVSCFCSYFFRKFNQFSHMQWYPCMLMSELTTLFSCKRRETLWVPNTTVPYAGLLRTLKVLENCSWCWKVLEFQC